MTRPANISHPRYPGKAVPGGGILYSLEYWIRDLGCECQICEMLIEQMADNFSNAAIRLLQTTSSID